MKTTYYIRSVANNSISNRVAFRHLENAIAKKKELEDQLASMDKPAKEVKPSKAKKEKK